MLIKKESVLNALGVFKDTKNADKHFMNGIETAKELINQAEEIELSYDDIFGTSWIAENCDDAYRHGVMDGKKALQAWAKTWESRKENAIRHICDHCDTPIEVRLKEGACEDCPIKIVVKEIFDEQQP